MSYIFKLSKLVPTLMIGIGIGSMTKIKQEKPTNTSFIADAAEKVLDSVVNITLESETTNLFKTSNYISSGSGFFINEDGTVLTNAHVVEDSTENSKIWIKTSNGQSIQGYVHSYDALADLAIVKPLQKGKFKRVLFGSNTNTRPGDFVVAIGCPLGLQNTITAGVVSALQRDSNEIGRKDNRVQYIQTDLVVHSGSSGGPLVNMDGRVIGINTTRAESEGISFAIRVDTAMEMIKMLQVKGKITRPFLGIHTKSLNPSFFSQLNEETKHQILPGTVGVLVTKVQKFTPAEKSGFLEGDIITKVHGEKVHNTQELLSRLGLTIGKRVDVTIRRTLPLDMDWDGRVNRYEVVEVVLGIVPEELVDYSISHV